MGALEEMVLAREASTRKTTAYQIRVTSPFNHQRIGLDLRLLKQPKPQTQRPAADTRDGWLGVRSSVDQWTLSPFSTLFSDKYTPSNYGLKNINDEDVANILL